MISHKILSVFPLSIRVLSPVKSKKFDSIALSKSQSCTIVALDWKIRSKLDLDRLYDYKSYNQLIIKLAQNRISALVSLIQLRCNDSNMTLPTSLCNSHDWPSWCSSSVCACNACSTSQTIVAMYRHTQVTTHQRKIRRLGRFPPHVHMYIQSLPSN